MMMMRLMWCSILLLSSSSNAFLLLTLEQPKVSSPSSIISSSSHNSPTERRRKASQKGELESEVKAKQGSLYRGRSAPQPWTVSWLHQPLEKRSPGADWQDGSENSEISLTCMRWNAPHIFGAFLCFVLHTKKQKTTSTHARTPPRHVHL